MATAIQTRASTSTSTTSIKLPCPVNANTQVPAPDNDANILAVPNPSRLIAWPHRGSSILAATMSSSTVTLSQWGAKRRKVFRSVFQHEFTQPTPQSTPSLPFPEHGQPFGGPPARSVAAALEPHPRPSPSRHNLRSGRSQTQADLRLPTTTSVGTRSILKLSAHPGKGLPASPHDVARDQARYDHAWHVVTSRISLPSSVAAEDSFGALVPESQLQSQDAASEHQFRAARDVVLDPRHHVPLALHTQDVMSWHMRQCRRHFGQHVLPMLNACVSPTLSSKGPSGETSAASSDDLLRVLENSIRTIEAAHRLYSYGFVLLPRGMNAEGGKASHKIADTISHWLDEINTLVEAAVSPDLMGTLRAVLSQLISIILGVRLAPTDSASDFSWLSGSDLFTKRAHLMEDDAETNQVAKCRLVLDALVRCLRVNGLAGEKFELLFADIMDEMMEQYIVQTCARRWESPVTETPKHQSKRPSRPHTTPSSCVQSLSAWVEDFFAGLAVNVLSKVRDGKHGQVSFQRMQMWKRLALGRVASLRISELFDIVREWPASKGGLDDLRVSVTTGQRRQQLVQQFAASLDRNLLNPGRSTLEILRTYIAIIRAFHYLDHTNVLLNRAVGPLQLYLCRRDDAVRIVVGGLLSSTAEVQDHVSGSKTGTEAAQPSKKLVELAVILNDPAQNKRRYVEDGDQDWNDMSWVPDPIDAGVNYRRPKSEDVIGTLINALGSKDVFIKEFQVIVAERLLSSQGDFPQEKKVLSLLKKRFGDNALQNCDVMMTDMEESSKIDGAIHRNRPSSRSLDVPQLQTSVVDDRLHTRILSRLYWPDLAKEGFNLPTPIADAQKRYEAVFEEIKAGRKLAWMDHLGQASVELELADRTVSVDCSTVEASIIYAFQEETPETCIESAKPVTRSVEELEEMLGMDVDLIRPALAFWVTKGVVRSDDNDRFTVIEDQSATTTPAIQPSISSPTKAASEGPSAPPPAPAKPVLSAKEKNQRNVYWQFITGMLTNNSSMPPAQMTMMLKMLIPDFAWNGEQLVEFLGDKVAEGVVEVVGGKYKLIKK